jgi:pimeloyl-ACP methyl ester carboxylesterase
MSTPIRYLLASIAICISAVTHAAAAATGSDSVPAATRGAAAVSGTYTTTAGEAKLAKIASTPDRYVEIDGMRIAYRLFGKPGTRPLVLLQRFRGTMDDWDPALLEPIARERTVILFDSAGVGRSEGINPDSIKGMSDFASDFIQALKLDSVDVLGFSMGGITAQELALDHPAQIGRVIIASASPGFVVDPPAIPPKVWPAASRPVNTDDDFLYLFFADSNSSQAAGRAHLDRLKLWPGSASSSVSADSVHAQSRAIQSMFAPQMSLLPRLSSMSQPVLIADGMHDLLMPTHYSYAMAKAIPDAKLIVYADAGHGFLFQYASDFGAEIVKFLEATEAR